jgi:hypothetical protein
MAPEELSPATRFDNLKMGFARWLKHDLRLQLSSLQLSTRGAQATCLPVLAASRNDISVGKLGW